jgi:hypothetical protein
MLMKGYNEEPRIQHKVSATNKFIGGYWENWKGAINPGSSSNKEAAYYSNDIKHFNHIYYSFLTLDKVPNPDSPHVSTWDGHSIYESMT